jgi:hypothetical protein
MPSTPPPRRRGGDAKEPDMTRTLAAALLALPVLAGPALATPPSENLYVGTDLETIQASFVAMGYTILTTGEDESGFEAEIRAGNDIYDVTIDPATGLILFVEIDEDDDGDV